LLDKIFPVFDYYNNTKIFCCWALKEAIKNNLNSNQKSFLIEKMITVQGNSEEVFAA
jgi:hypothetical protein